MKDNMNTPPPTIKEFDPLAYAGLWYEIARYPFKWERGCTGATAEYFVTPSGLVVKNTCYSEQSSYVRTGRARTPDMLNPGQLLVRFDESRGIPADPEGDYWIHWTDYVGIAIVGGRNREHLWILSRRPAITRQESRLILEIVSLLGYDSKRLLARAVNVV